MFRSSRLSFPVGTEITLRGWVRSRRDSKGITFIELNDGSRFKSIQLVVDAGVVPDETLKRVTTGGSIAAGGTLVESPAKGQAVELKVRPCKSTAAPTRRLTRCKRRDTRWNSCARFPTCACAATPSARSFACATPSPTRSTIFSRNVVSSTCKRRSSRPSIAKARGKCSASRRSNLHNPPRTADGKLDWTQDFFGKPAYLTVSGQLEAEIFALRSPRFTLSAQRFAPKTATRRATWRSSG